MTQRRALSIALIAEDTAHDMFVSALVRRVAREEKVDVVLNVVSGVGGAGRAMSQLIAYQHAFKGTLSSAPDLLVVAIDANCKGWNVTRAEIESRLDKQQFPRWAVACPDPHVEKWYLADGVALLHVFGKAPMVPKQKCARGVYKRCLRDYIESTGSFVTLGGAEYASDIVDAIDLYRAGKSDSALKAFVDSVRGVFRESRALHDD